MPARQVHGVLERPHDRDLLLRVGAGDVAAAADLYDRYGARLYALAAAVSGPGPDAEAAVVTAFRTASERAARAEGRPWELLARETVAACPGRTATPSAALVALTVLGGHLLDEAAAALGMDPGVAATCLRDALRGEAGATD